MSSTRVSKATPAPAPSTPPLRRSMAFREGDLASERLDRVFAEKRPRGRPRKYPHPIADAPSPPIPYPIPPPPIALGPAEEEEPVPAPADVLSAAHTSLEIARLHLEALDRLFVALRDAQESRDREVVAHVIADLN